MDLENQKINIVVIDDDEDLMNMLVYAIESEGYKVHGISTGKEALAYLSDKNKMKDVSLIILDRLLDDMDGIEILKKLEKSSYSKIPVIVLSMLSAKAMSYPD